MFSQDETICENLEIPPSECSNTERSLGILPDNNHSNTQYNSTGIYYIYSLCVCNLYELFLNHHNILHYLPR